MDKRTLYHDVQQADYLDEFATHLLQGIPGCERVEYLGKDPDTNEALSDGWLHIRVTFRVGKEERLKQTHAALNMTYIKDVPDTDGTQLVVAMLTE